MSCSRTTIYAADVQDEPLYGRSPSYPFAYAIADKYIDYDKTIEELRVMKTSLRDRKDEIIKAIKDLPDFSNSQPISLIETIFTIYNIKYQRVDTNTLQGPLLITQTTEEGMYLFLCMREEIIKYEEVNIFIYRGYVMMSPNSTEADYKKTTELLNALLRVVWKMQLQKIKRILINI
jgi:hypothetical protein